MKNIKILDCTLRDGGRIIDCAFENAIITNIAKKLTDARNYINSNGFSPTDIFRFLLDEYVPQMEPKYRAQAIMILGQWEPQCAFSSMPDLMVACALLDIMNLEV